MQTKNSCTYPSPNIKNGFDSPSPEKIRLNLRCDIGADHDDDVAVVAGGGGGSDGDDVVDGNGGQQNSTLKN